MYEIKTIKNGLSNSMGWNLGNIPPKSIHLFDPLTSIPMKITKNKKIKKITKKIKLKFNSFFFSKKEKVINIDIPSNTKNKCFIKKQQEFVFNLSEAIKEVETNEKKSPSKNKVKIKNNINLSTFFHQL